MLTLPEYREESWRLEATCCHSSERPSANAGGRNSQRVYCHYYSSSSSRRAIRTDILDPLSSPLSIVHCLQQVFRFTSGIGTELLYVDSSWSSCLYSSMWRGPQECTTYELVPTSPAVSRMSGSSNFDCFCGVWLVAVQLLLCRVLSPWLVQYCSILV